MKTMIHAAQILSLTLAAAACGGSGSSGESTAQDTTASAPSAGMEGMQMPQQGEQQGEQGGMDAEMRTHMSMMHGADGDSLKAMVPMHRQMAGNMLARMNREMGQMNMTADAAWTATVDSIRQDLTQMPEMGTEELKAMLPAHEARLSRLGQMHHSMMGNMRM